MTLSSKARKVLAASLALSTVVWSVSLFAMPFAFAAAHSNGCLVNANGTLWLIDNGQRRGFPSAEVLLSNGYNFSQAVTATSDDTNLPVGPIMTFADGTLVKGPSDPLVYLVANGQKRGFVSASVFSGLGFQFAKIWTAAVNTFADLPTGANLESTSERHTKGVLVIDGTGTVWLMTGTGRMGIPSMDVFNSYGFSWDRTVPVNAADVAAPVDGVLTARPGCSDTVNPGQPADGFNPNGGTQGSINNISTGSREDDEANEGQNNVEIYAADVETDNDGALLLKSADVWFSQSATDGASTKPWDYFEDVSLLSNGTKVATLSADSSSDWSDDTNGTFDASGTDKEYRLRFSNLSVVLANDDITTLSVAVSVKDNLDSEDQEANWYVSLGSVRVQDESNFTTDYTETDDISQAFTMGDEDTAELEVRDADDDIDASVIKVSKTSDTNGVAIYSFDLEETNDVDVNIDELELTFATTGSENNVIRKAYLYQGNTKVGEETMTSNGVVDFDNMDIDIDGDDSETFTVKVDLYDTNDGERYSEGTTVSVDFTSLLSATDANGHDEDDINPVSGTATGNTHELRTEGINVEFVSASQSKTFVADSEGESDQGTYTITFDVTAFGDDMRLDRESLEDGDQTDGEGVSYLITHTDDNTSTSLLSSSTSDSEDTAYTFEVDEGTTRRFTLTVVATADSGTNTFAEVSIESINWGTATTDNGNGEFYTFDLNDFKTGALNLVGIAGA